MKQAGIEKIRCARLDLSVNSPNWMNAWLLLIS